MCRSRRSSRMSSMRIWSPTGSSTYTSGWARRCTRSGSPISCAAKATAAARLPTPGGPWKRYACAGPSASAARSRRLASACSGKLSNASTDLLRDLVGAAVAIHRLDSIRKHLGQRTVRLVDGAVERLPLALDPVGRRAAPRSDLGLDEDEEGAVGQQPVRRREVKLQHAVDAEVTGDPLVGERRVDVAVADDVLALLERGRDHALDELRAGRSEQRRFGPRAHVEPVEKQPPDFLAERGAARFARCDDVPSLGPQSLG